MKDAALITAISAVLMGVPAIVQAQGTDVSQMILADDLEDANIYSDLSGSAWAGDTAFETVDPEWESIGEVEDLVLDRSGRVAGVVAEVGGFLGLGDKDVLLPIEGVRIVPDSGSDDGFALVVQETQESLEAMPEVDRGLFD